jgi:nicotinate-nucleotide adenylyltransferase
MAVSQANLRYEVGVKMSKIGIMGGTFNPIHLAHLIMAEHAYEQFSLDKILFMPSKNPPHKPQTDIISDLYRSRMVQLAIEDNPHFEFSSLEIDREGTTYTFETLEDLSKKYPDNEYYFILGADSLFTIEHWRNPGRIFELSQVIAAGRDHLSDEEMIKQIAYISTKFYANIHLLRTPNMDISSQMLREKIRLGQSIRYYVPKEVEEYILEHKLYKE